MTTTNRNARNRVFILALLLLILCLGAAVGGMAHDTAVQRDSSSSQAAPADSSAAALFMEGGLYGLRSASGRVLIKPTWYSLRMMSDSVFIARKGGGENDRVGLLQTNGDLIVPLIYKSFHQISDDIWAAEIVEGGSERYHLYRSDGTRWRDAAWDTCTCEDGLLTLTDGRNTFTCTEENGVLRRETWYSEHAVGLHTLRMDFSGEQLARLPEDDVLLALGDTAAEYLSYLFLGSDAPDPSLISAEDPAAVKVAYRYTNCTLATANVSRLLTLQTGGYPSYLMQIQVTYKRNHTEGRPEVVYTAMYLTVTRNAAGAFTYSGFTDTQMAASSAAQINTSH